jgi:RES domain.
MPTAPHRADLARIDAHPPRHLLLDEVGFSERERAEIDQLPGADFVRQHDLSWLFDRFTPRPGSIGFSRGRFGDGSHPVFYSAKESETAVAEYAHHYQNRVRTGQAPARPYLVGLYEFHFDGSSKDLRPLAPHYPVLVDPNPVTAYPACQEIGRDAFRSGPDAFLTVSARWREGTCVPIFRRQVLERPAFISGIHILPD